MMSGYGAGAPAMAPALRDCTYRLSQQADGWVLDCDGCRGGRYATLAAALKVARRLAAEAAAVHGSSWLLVAPLLGRCRSWRLKR